MTEDQGKILAGLVRVGVVTETEREARKVRVRFPAEGLQSGWLYVLQHEKTGVKVVPDGKHTHALAAAGEHTHPGSTGHEAAVLNIIRDGEHAHTAGTEPEHDHEGTVTTWWVPEPGERVLCLYLPVFNGDGFVLGGI